MTTVVGEKLCTRCGEMKRVDQFGHDKRQRSGLKSRCKTCEAQLSREWRAANPEKVRAQGRGKYARYPDQHRAKQQRWRAENPEHSRRLTRAHVRVYYALRRGELVKAEACEDCGTTTAPLDGHHPDHDKPLEVRWLCRPCHRKADKEGR